MKYGLGRVHAVDTRDANYPLSALLSTTAPPKRIPLTQYWDDNGGWLDQGNTPQCVAYAWSHWTLDGPVLNKLVEEPSALYHDAQLVDEWPGENYEGTSVRAGAKVLKTKKLISAYYWAANVNEIIAAVMVKGPMVIGGNWSDTMFYPDSRGIVHYNPRRVVGGHAWVINGYNRNTRLFRGKNSWGKSWGREGHFYISDVDLGILLRSQGEACIATELKLP